MRVRRIGYAPAKETMDVVPALERTVTVTLEPLPVQLDSVTVAAAIGGVAIDGAELERRGGDLARALDGWEGIVVRRAGNGPAAPQVRGGAPDEVLVLVDGFPTLNDPFTGRADLSRLELEVAGVVAAPRSADRPDGQSGGGRPRTSGSAGDCQTGGVWIAPQTRPGQRRRHRHRPAR